MVETKAVPTPFTTELSVENCRNTSINPTTVPTTPMVGAKPSRHFENSRVHFPLPFAEAYLVLEGRLQLRPLLHIHSQQERVPRETPLLAFWIRGSTANPSTSARRSAHLYETISSMTSSRFNIEVLKSSRTRRRHRK